MRHSGTKRRVIATGVFWSLYPVTEDTYFPELTLEDRALPAYLPALNLGDRALPASGYGNPQTPTVRLVTRKSRKYPPV